MLWLWILLSILATLIILPLLLGQFLPNRYEGKMEAIFGCSPEQFWAGLHDPHTFPVTGRQMKKVVELSDVKGLPVWTEDMGPSAVTITTVKSTPCSHLIREMKDSVVPMTARSEIHLESHESGCKVIGSTVIELKSGTWHVPYFRTMLFLFNGAKMGLKNYLNRIGRGAPPQSRAA